MNTVQSTLNSKRQNGTNDSLAILKLNIKLLDEIDATLSSILTDKQLIHKFTDNMPKPMFKTTLFHMVNLVMDAPTAKWITLCHYTMNSWDTSTDSTHARLRLVPFDAKTGIIDGISRKLPTTPQNKQVIGDHKIGRYRRIGITGTSSDAIKEPPGGIYKKLDYQESPWIECTTISSINSLQLEI